VAASMSIVTRVASASSECRWLQTMPGKSFTGPVWVSEACYE
jgi:hypothetical protein